MIDRFEKLRIGERLWGNVQFWSTKTSVCATISAPAIGNRVRDTEGGKLFKMQGVGLREIARNMKIPEGTVLSRSKREGWTRQIQSAKALAKREKSGSATNPV